MLSRVSLNLALLGTVLVSYATVASGMNDQEYCLGGDSITNALPSGSHHLFCSTLDVHTPSPPELHWGALLPGGA